MRHDFAAGGMPQRYHYLATRGCILPKKAARILDSATATKRASVQYGAMPPNCLALSPLDFRRSKLFSDFVWQKEGVPLEIRSERSYRRRRLEIRDQTR
jgi:hypothetical protein